MLPPLLPLTSFALPMSAQSIKPAATPCNDSPLLKVDVPDARTQSIHSMGERLLAYAAQTQRDALISLARRPTGLEGLPGVKLNSKPADPKPASVGLSSEQTVCLLETGSRTLDALIVEQQDNASPSSRHAVRQMALAVPALVEGNFELAQRTCAGTPAGEMVTLLSDQLRAIPQSSTERAKALLDFYGKVLCNEFESKTARWAANVHNVVLRDLATVGLTTTLRQLAGMALESRFILDELAPTTRQWIGASVMLLGPCLNILGALRDEANGVATPTSRLARGAMLGLSLGVLGAALAVNPPGPLAQLASFATQATLYTVLRDLMQLLAPLKDNTSSLNAPSTALAGLGYAGTQTLSSLLMDTLAPHSGAGYPMQVAAKAEQAAESLMTQLLAQSVAHTLSSTSTSTSISTTAVRAQITQAIEQLSPQLSHDIMRGLLNTIAEVSDDLLRPAIARHREIQTLIASTRAEAIMEGRDPEEAVQNIPVEQRQGLRIYFETPRLPILGGEFPTREQFLNQMLTTNAMRTSIFQSILGAILTTGTVLGKLGLSPTQESWASYGVLAAVVQVGYTPFLLAHATRAVPTPASAAYKKPLHECAP